MDGGAEDEAVLDTGLLTHGGASTCDALSSDSQFAGVRHAPPGQRAGKFRDIGLGVSAVRADRVQFEDLAGEVLVRPRLTAFPRHAVRADGLGLIEVKQHGRVPFGRQRQVLEPAEDVGPDGLALVLADEDRGLELGRRGREGVGQNKAQRSAKPTSVVAPSFARARNSCAVS